MSDQSRSSTEPPALSKLTAEALQLIPKLLWFGFAVVVFAASYRPLLNRLDDGEVSKVSFATFQIEFVRSEYNKAKDARLGAAPASAPVGFEYYADRIGRSAMQLSGLRALWVDDLHPAQNFAERRALTSLGVSVDLARDSDQAQALFDMADEMNSPYHLVISDMHRSPEEDPITATCFPAFAQSASEAGCKLLQVVQGRYGQGAPPFIFYSGDGDARGTPPGAFGATADFGTLFGLVLDAAERRRPDPERPSKAEGSR